MNVTFGSEHDVEPAGIVQVVVPPSVPTGPLVRTTSNVTLEATACEILTERPNGANCVAERGANSKAVGPASKLIGALAFTITPPAGPPAVDALSVYCPTGPLNSTPATVQLVLPAGIEQNTAPVSDPAGPEG